MGQHSTGYMVGIYGESYWHRSLERAEARAIEAARYCTNVQVLDCATGELVSGRPE